MAYLLFPGRHLVNTAFQRKYVQQVVETPPAELSLYGGAAPKISDQLTEVVFAITSANQQFSRYNPIPYPVRAIGVDRFGNALRQAFGLKFKLFGIPHYPPSARFAEMLLEEIEQQSEYKLKLVPSNCLVLCSTPALIEQFAQLGFGVLPAEMESPGVSYPITLIEKLGQASANWPEIPELSTGLVPSTFQLFEDFPHAVIQIQRLWQDPLLTEEGSLTETRDYASYAWEMSQPTVINLKYKDIQQFIKEGRIVDEGCADGALLTCIAKDFPDSDLIGLEITGEFMARCQEMQRAGVFGGSYIHFHQRNILNKVFEDNSIDTTICNSTTHELYSYGNGEVTLKQYLQLKFDQCKPGGRIIIRDVIGPENGQKDAWLWLNHKDGLDEEAPFKTFNTPEELEAYLGTLSTKSLFIRFARDFRPNAPSRFGDDALNYFIENFDGQYYANLTLREAAEFILAKDYHNNWESEMNEEFCFYSLSDWLEVLRTAGFQPIIDPQVPTNGCHAYTNPWIEQNRWEGKIKLYSDSNGRPHSLLPAIPTNVVLVAQKP